MPAAAQGWQTVSATFPSTNSAFRSSEFEPPVDMTSWAPEYSRSYGDPGGQFQSSFDERPIPTMAVQTQPVDLRFPLSPGVSPKELFLFHNFQPQQGSFMSSEESAFDDQMEMDEADTEDVTMLDAWPLTSHLLPAAEPTHFEMETDTFDEEDDSEEQSELSRHGLDDDEPSISLKENPFSDGSCYRSLVPTCSDLLLVVLPPSKTPCLDALAFCVVMGLGCEIDKADDSVIYVTDCSKLLAFIKVRFGSFRYSRRSFFLAGYVSKGEPNKQLRSQNQGAEALVQQHSCQEAPVGAV